MWSCKTFTLCFIAISLSPLLSCVCILFSESLITFVFVAVVVCIVTKYSKGPEIVHCMWMFCIINVNIPFWVLSVRRVASLIRVSGLRELYDSQFWKAQAPAFLHYEQFNCIFSFLSFYLCFSCCCCCKIVTCTNS